MKYINLIVIIALLLGHVMAVPLIRTDEINTTQNWNSQLHGVASGTSTTDVANMGQLWAKLNKSDATFDATLWKSGTTTYLSDPSGSIVSQQENSASATVIQYAIDNYRYIRVTPATYYINTTIFSNGKKYTLVGDHETYCIFQAGSGLTGRMWYEYQSYPRISHIRFDGYDVSTVGGPTDDSIDGMVFNGLYGGNTLTSCVFRDFNRSIWYKYGVVGTLVEDCDFGYSNIGVLLSTGAGNPSDNNMNTFKSCMIRHNDYGVVIFRTAYANAFTENIIEINSIVDVLLCSNYTESGYYIGGNVFDRNYIESSGAGQVEFKINRSSTGGLVQHTKILNNQFTSFKATQDLITIEDAVETYITGNSLHPYSCEGDLEIGVNATRTIVVYNFGSSVSPWDINDAGTGSVIAPNY